MPGPGLPPGFRWVRDGDLTYLSYDPPEARGPPSRSPDPDPRPVVVSDHGYGTYLIVDPYDGNLYHAGGPEERGEARGRSRGRGRRPRGPGRSASLLGVMS